MPTFRNLVAAALVVASIAAPAAVRAAQEPVPSPAEVLGHELGERFTDHDGVVRYFQALAAASPLVELRRYGETAEGRPLLRAVIARADYRARLDEILDRNRELAEPDTPEARAREIVASNPAVVYFSYGVHGNESSSSEAAMWTAWDLAAGRESVAGVLDSVVVVIDPAVNPDGRDRYVDWYRRARAHPANANPEAREHWEPWPGGRTNHYLFDLNRDWAWQTQPETRARLENWDYWSPQVHVDFHEMSWQSSYFFFPAAEPINPLYPEHILEWGNRFGRGNAEAFDAQGWTYYTGESYDYFYPGYGDTWPGLVGAIGMTYEQAGGGRAGLAIERPDGLTLTLRDRAEHHRATGAATLRTTARGKSQLLLDFARFHRNVDRGLPDILLVPGQHPGRVAALIALLQRNGIAIERAGEPFEAEAEPHEGYGERGEFPAGTYLVRARQPHGRLAITLLQAETVLDATFSYDVSAWSLPYAYGIEAHAAESVPDAGWTTVAPDSAAPVAAAGDAPLAFGGGDGTAAAEPFGYLVAPGFGAWPAMVAFLEEDGRAIVLEDTFRLADRAWPRGTIFLPRQGNGELAAGIEASGLARWAVPVQTGFTPEGPDLGTEESYTLELPRIAVLAGEGVSAGSFGTHWFFLERTLGLAFDALPADRIDDIALDDYDVLVLPDLDGGTLDEERLEHIEAWVRRGGTVVAVAGAAEAVAEPLAEIEVREEDADGQPAGEQDVDEERQQQGAAAQGEGTQTDRGEGDQARDTARALRGREARELEEWEQEVPGTILPLRIDPAHPLAFGAAADGTPERMHILHSGELAFEPDEDFETVAYFPDDLEKVSGVISEENLERLSQASWLATRAVDDGRVILFADDPLFRHFWYAGFQPYVNALIVGPAL